VTAQLQGHVAIVTGGGRGFGRAIATRLAAEGAAVTVTARSQAQLDSTVSAIEAAGGRALAVTGDVTNRQDVARVVGATTKRFGPVTLMINNAGVGKATQIRLTQHVAAEGKEHGISAFAIEPGTVFTELAAGTIASPEAQRWLPGMLTALQEIRERDDPAVGLARCGQMCVDLASGRFDGLSGSYLTPQDDFADLLVRRRT
jgi:NAD(P)-dependent dehydrogenase (short-subunit alcohol dehydrogenase family)